MAKKKNNSLLKTIIAKRRGIILALMVLIAIPLTVLMAQQQQNTKQEAAVTGAVGTYCTSNTNCSAGLICSRYKCIIATTTTTRPIITIIPIKPNICGSNACGTTVNGGTCISYPTSSVGCGQTCSTRISTCNNGTWNIAPYSYKSCISSCTTITTIPSNPTCAYQKAGDYLCSRCSTTSKYCYATWHEGDSIGDRNNVISATTYVVNCNCKTGTNSGTCPNGKSTAVCGK